MHKLKELVGLASLYCILLGCADPDSVPETHISTPLIQRLLSTLSDTPQRTALFGDLHVHTSWSADAYSGGNRLGQIPHTAC